MKVKGYDKVIAMHLGKMFDAVNEDGSNMTMLHRMLLNLPNLSETAVTKIATNGFSKVLKEHDIFDPFESQYMRYGFAPYGEELGNVFALAIPGTKAITFRVEKRERVLPAISVRRATEERMAALIAKEVDGFKPTRKDWAQMKDEVQAEMLKHAPIRPTMINMTLDVPYLYIHTSSAKVAEDCTAMLRKALGSLPVEHALADEYTLQHFMGSVIKGEYSNIDGENFAHVKHIDGDDVKLKDIDIENNDILTDLLASAYTARAITMAVDTDIHGIGSVSFKLSDKAIITDLHIGEADIDAHYEATLDRYGTDGGQFMTMMANLFQLVTSLKAVMSIFDDHGQLAEFTREFDDPDDIMSDEDEDDDEV